MDTSVNTNTHKHTHASPRAHTHTFTHITNTSLNKHVKYGSIVIKNSFVKFNFYYWIADLLQKFHFVYER